MEEEKLPAGVSHLAPEIGIKNVPGKFVDTFLEKTIPKKSLEESGLNVYTFTLEPGTSKIEKKKSNPKKYNLKNSVKKSLYNLPKDSLKFAEFYPIHLMWKEYMEQILGDFNGDKNQLYPKLMKADYHGCYLVVASSNCSTMKGQRGLVVRETRNTFQLLTHNDKIITIPKKGNIFAFEFKGKMVKIYGDNFGFQAAERMKVKFKAKQLNKL